MKIAVTGANGAVGQSILRYGAAVPGEPHQFVALVRSERAADELRSQAANSTAITVRCISYTDPDVLAAALAGANAVVHLSGILVESATSTYEQAHVGTTRAVVEAAKRAAVEKLVLVSATGADEKSRNGYWRTKGQAEALVRSSGLVYTILRVPLLLGVGTEGAAALKRNAFRNNVKLIGGGRNFQQPLDVSDVAKAALIACRPSVAKNRTLELVGPVPISERELVERAGRLLGHEVHVSSLSKGLMRLLLQISRLTRKRGFSVDALEVITADTRLDPNAASQELGIQLTGVDEMIKSSLELTNG